jgi:hypothetical protein
MATLFDLAQAYLNRALPETFRYDRTQPPTIGPITRPEPIPGPVVPLLPRPGGNEEGFSVYNPDPNRTRTPDRYSPYNYRQAAERSLIGSGDSQFDINKYGTGFRSETEANKFMDMYPDYYQGKQLTGIPGAIQGYMKNSIPGQLIGSAVRGIESLLPVNNRAILENELLGQGFQLNDIGQFVSDGGDAYKEDGSNIMAGYNAAKVTRQTFDKRREKAKKNMTPEGFEKFNKALTAAEEKFFAGSGKATTVFNDKLKQKDIKKGFINDQGSTYDEAGIKSILDTPTGINRPGSKSKGPPTGINRPGSKSKGPPTGINRPGTPSKPKGPKPGSSNPRRPGPGDRGRGQSNVGTKSKGPVSTKGQAGPPSQRGGGGGGGGGGGCFLKGTLITMLDGTRKPVEQVDLGNEVAIGGKVFATGKFLVKNLHDYKGIKVSGSHMVSENNKWIRVEDSEHGKLLGNEEHTVYVFGSENRRILINDILFTDYFEVNEQDKLMNNEEDFFDNWKLYAKQDSGNNVDIINAS